VITALNGLTVYSTRMQAHIQSLLTVSGHIFYQRPSRARRHAGRTGDQVRQLDQQFDIAIRAGRFVAG